MSGDEISLTLPADDAFHSVAHLVLGGLAVRLDLTFENLEDLELAIDTLLERSTEGDDVTIRVHVLDEQLRTTIGPFTGADLELEEGGEGDLNPRRILDTVCDSVEIVNRDGAQWVVLTKRIETVGNGKP
jgi:hypothetical protein